MTNYRIQAFYQTGDSNGSENTFDVLSAVWTDLDTAKKALQDLKKHHEYYERDEDSRWYKGPITQEDMDNIHTNPWYVKPERGNLWYFSIAVELSKGSNSRMVCSTPYHGYFERLQSLKIIVETPEETDMEINF